MGVLAYQLVIFVGVMLATAVLGAAGLWVAAGAAVLWTLSMVFTKGLMALQLGTIVLGAFAGVALRAAGLYIIVIAAVAAVGWMILGKNGTTFRTSVPAGAVREQAQVPAATPPSPPTQPQMLAPPTPSATGLPRHRSESGDLRSCLQLESREAIARCAQQ